MCSLTSCVLRGIFLPDVLPYKRVYSLDCNSSKVFAHFLINNIFPNFSVQKFSYRLWFFFLEDHPPNLSLMTQLKEKHGGILFRF